MSARETFNGRSVLRREIDALADQFAAADRRAKQAQNIPDREQAEAARREADGQFFAAGEELADLFLLLLRYALLHRPEALKLYIMEMLKGREG